MSVKLWAALGVACVGATIAIFWFVARLWPVPGWTHDPSGLVFPNRVAGMKLNSMGFWPRDESWGHIGYETVDGDGRGATVTVYIYRSALPKASIWPEDFRKVEMETREYGVAGKVMPVQFPRESRYVGLLSVGDDEIWSYEEGVRQGSLTAMIPAGEWRLFFLMSNYTEGEEPTNVREPFNALIQKIGGLAQKSSAFVDEAVPLCREPLGFSGSKPVDLRIDSHAFLHDVAPKLLTRERPQCRQEIKHLESEEGKYSIYYWNDEMGGYSQLFQYENYAVHFVKVEPRRVDGPYAEILVTPKAVYLVKFHDLLPSRDEVNLSELVNRLHYGAHQNPLATFLRQ